MLRALLDLFYPKTCPSCSYPLGDHESYLCTNCRHELPLTHFHKTNDPAVAKIFYGRALIEQATALLRFEKKGIVQKLLHQLKYKGQEGIGLFLGAWLGEELKGIPSYTDVDVVIPVPLHKKKLRRRGYNQVEKFGEQIAQALDAQYIDDILIKISNTRSQVSKKRFARWTDTDQIFSIVKPETLANTHILLVDDIVTTGATLEACITQLNKAKNIKISIAVMALV